MEREGKKKKVWGQKTVVGSYFRRWSRVNGNYQDLHRPLLREEGDGAPASSGTQ